MFSKRLTIAFGILAIIALCQGTVAWWAIDSASNNVLRGRLASDVLSGFIELSATKQRLRTWLSQALLDAGADPLQRDGYQKDMAATLAKIEALAKTSAELDANQFPQNSEHKLRKDALSVLRVSLEELKGAMASTRAMSPNSDAKAAWTEVTRVFNVSQGLDLRTLLIDSIARERIAVERERAAADKSLRLVRGLAFGATVALALAAMFLAAYFVRALHRPLKELTAGAHALQRGNLNHHIPDERDDEFARFATSVNAMAVELAQHRQIEAATRQRLEELVAVRTTELEQALQALQQVDIRRRKLFADISHELRTPTTAIRGEAEIALRGGEKPSSDYRASLRRIVETAVQLGTVIDDLLTMARSDIDTLALNRIPMDVQEPLRDAIDQAQSLGHQRNVRIESPSGVTPRVRLLADAQRLRQLFILLLDNAVRYSYPDGFVQVHTRLVSDSETCIWWELQITDHGIGIPPEEMPHVFERNFRGDRAQLHQSDGNGLGLSIAASLARAHGGNIAFESPNLPETRVTLRLPVLNKAIESTTSPLYEHTHC